MAKTYQKLQLLALDVSPELSILENRKNNQAGTMRSAEDYTHRSVPKRIGLCRKASSSKRGLRKSSSLTNGMSPGRNKTALREYGTEARGLDLSPFCNHLSMRPSWASADTFSIT
jgi:hypothetical protein